MTTDRWLWHGCSPLCNWGSMKFPSSMNDRSRVSHFLPWHSTLHGDTWLLSRRARRGLHAEFRGMHASMRECDEPRWERHSNWRRGSSRRNTWLTRRSRPRATGRLDPRDRFDSGRSIEISHRYSGDESRSARRSQRQMRGFQVCQDSEDRGPILRKDPRSGRPSRVRGT